MDSQKLEEFLRVGFPSHRPSCLETGEHIDIEHHMVFNAFLAAQPELILLEKAMKAAMVPAGTARESDFGREVPVFNVDASVVESEFQKLYFFFFDYDNMGYNAEQADIPMQTAIFIVNFDKVRMDPMKNDTDLDSLEWILAGALLGVGVVNCGIRNDCDPDLALLVDYLDKEDSSIRIGAINGLGLAYAGTQNEQR